MLLNGHATDAASRSLGVVRVPPSVRIELTMQSKAFIMLGTHWFDRQLLCGGEECPACIGSPMRVKAYAIATVGSEHSTTPGLLELTPQCISSVQDVLDAAAEEGAPAPRFALSRAKRRSRVQIEHLGWTNNRFKSYEEPKRIVEAVSVLHGVRPPSALETLEEWSASILPSVNLLLQRAMA